MPESFFKLLPAIASHPLAVVAAVCVVAVWVLWAIRRAKSKDFLSALKAIPPEQREKFCRNSGYRYDELAQPPERQRLKLLTRRYWLIAVLASLGLIALLILATLLVRYQEKVEIRKAVEVIEKDRVELQKKLDEERRESAQLVIGVSGVMESASTAARLTQNPELKLNAEKLERLLNDFDARFLGHRSPEVSLAIRLARATAANAQGAYPEALRLVSESEAESAVLGAKELTDQAIGILQVHADAYFGQNNWLLALRNYQRITAIRSDDAAALNGAGNCLWSLHLPKAAETNFTKLVSIYEQSLKEGRKELAKELAISFSNRGNAYSDQGKFSEAIQDYDRAVESLNNRGNAYVKRGKPSKAIEDYDRSVELSRDLVEGRGQLEFTALYSLRLIARARANLKGGKLVPAREDCRKVLTMSVQSDLTDAARKLLGEIELAFQQNPSTVEIPQ